MFTVALPGKEAIIIPIFFFFVREKKASPVVTICITLILCYKPTYQVLYNDLSCKIKL